MLTNKQLNLIIENSIKNILTESQESESQKQAIKYLMTNLNWDKERANQFVRVDLRNDVTSLRDKQIAKFTLGVTRMYVDGQLRDANTISNLNVTLKLLSAHLNEYDRNLNGLSAQDLISRFEKTRQDNLENDKNEINSMQFGVSDYDIVPINSFEEAQQYYKYTNPNSRWCLTHMENMFESYTSGGINQIYFCLKHGFESIKPIVGDGAPLDEYGLSMISVIVNENGELAYCTCRWNHDNGGSDSVMTAKQVSEVVNVNFYEVFKPNMKWQNILNDVMERVRNGEDWNEIFDEVGDFSEGFAMVAINEKWNFINQEGRLLSNQWFDEIDDFREGFASVELNDEWNFINQEGKLLSNQWFDIVDDFREGFARVFLNGGWNFINQEGELLSNQWFARIFDFREGFSMVFLNGGWNFINQEGKLLSNQWFDGVRNFREGFAMVELNDEWNFINQEGKYLSNHWFEYVGIFSEGFAMVELNGKWNFINQEGRYLSNQWFSSAFDFGEGFARIKLNGKWNFINQEGKLLSNQWFDDVDYFSEGFARVGLNGKWGKIDTNGKFYISEGKQNKKTVIITENQERALLGLLTESQESESQKQAIKYLMTNLNWDKERANQFVRVDLRNDVTSLRDKQIAKFTLGVTRMFVQGQLRDARTISDINATLKLLSAHLNEYDRNLNGLSATDLISRFEKTRQDSIENDKNEINSMQFGTSDYDIVPINSFEEAEQYYEYTNPNSRWCLTHMENMFESYTSGGINQIYFCLKHGFENIKPIAGENAPLDEYGLSMISVIVNENGELAYCTSRWNHDNGGSDSVMGAKELSKVVNVNFYEVFKPNTKWRDMVNDTIERLRNGEDWNDIFDEVGDFGEGFAAVRLNKKWNFINQEGRLLSNQWFDWVDNFSGSFARIKMNGKCNFINQKGELLSNQWFDIVNYFREGFAVVELDEKYNFINQEGRFLSNQWFDIVGNFSEGFAMVRLNWKYNFINQEGKLLSRQWFDIVFNFSEGFAKVKLNGDWNFINQEGRLISNQWFNYIDDFSEGFAIVKLNDECNFINQEGKIVSNQWFDFIGNFSEGFAEVELDGKYNFINQEGKLLSNQWFDLVGDFREGFGIVRLNGEYAKIDTNGKLYTMENKENKKTVIITESQERALLGLLTESQESESQKQAIKYLMTNLNWDKERANQFVRVDLRNDVTSLRDKQIAKFTLGVTRMFVQGQLRDARTISDINATLKLLSAHLNEYDRNLNGLSATELISRFEKTRQDSIENDKNEINSMQFGTSDYDIVPINSFEEAEQYYEYTNPNSRWCLTHMRNMFESYTSGGINQIYFCLKHGFENIKPIAGENAPLDEYGLSMLSVIVNENGELAYCTSRWNHDNGGSDSVMTAKEISKVVNVNFYEVFKSNNKWRDMVNNAMERVRNGEDWDEIFDEVGNFSEIEGFYEVELNGKWNFINQEGRLLSDQWFDRVFKFRGGFAVVKLNGKYNFINQEGGLVSNQWFDVVGYFNEGFANVILNGKWNFINQEGELLSDQWFESVDDFSEGFAEVELNGKANFINQEGKLLSNQWFDWVGNFSEGFASVKLNKKYNLINQEGRLLSNQWFDYVYNFSEGFAVVKLNGKCNFINQEGGLVSSQWFDWVDNFSEGFAEVELDEKWNFINQEGRLLSNEWFDRIGNFNEGFATVELNGKYSKIDTNGKLYMMESKQRGNSVRLTELELRHMINESIKNVLKKIR